ncbi:MAG: hypothetical protein AAGA48_01170 [Myxococcota bacterium]
MSDETLDVEPVTAGERALIEAVKKGRRARCRGEVVRASMVRRIAMEGVPGGPVPSSIAIDEAIIEGMLDLEGCAIDWPLLFFACQFGSPGHRKEPLVVRDARLRRLGLHECQVYGGIKAERIQVESSLFMGRVNVDGPLRMRGAKIGGSLNLEEATLREPGNAISLDSAEIGGNWLMRDARIEGTVRFLGATLNGSLLMEGADIRSVGLAMSADSADIQGAWVLNKATVAGWVRLRSAKLRAFVATNAAFLEPVDANTLSRPPLPPDDQVLVPADELPVPDADAETRESTPMWARDPRDQSHPQIVVNLNGARVDGDIALRRSTVVGGLSIRHAYIEGVVTLERATIEGSPPALDATGINASQGIALDHAVVKGGLTLEGARVSRDLAATGLTVKTVRGRAITADVIRVEGNWLMRGAKLTGTVRMSGAQIDGQLAMADCRVKGRDLAIRADGVSIGGGWFMSRAKIDGLVRFPASTIGNQLRFSGASITVNQGPAVFANGITVKRDVVLADGFATAGGLTFDQSRVHGTLNLRGSRMASAHQVRGEHVQIPDERGEQLVTRYDTSAFSLVDSVVDRLQMPREGDHRPQGIVDLSRAQAGSLDDHADAWPPHGPDVDDTFDHLVLDGFTYNHLENPAGVDEGDGRSDAPVWSQRLAWLEGQAQRDLDELFRPAPWIQLAGRLRAQGYQEDARQITIARERRHRRSASVRVRERWQSVLLDWFALYGHNPWRTVGWIVVFVLLFAGVWSGAEQMCKAPDCRDEQVFVRTKRGEFADDLKVLNATYPEFNALAYSFDLFVPVVDFGHREFWRPNTRFRPLVEVQLPKEIAPDVRVDLTVGELLYILTIVEMVLGLILTSLAVTGFTGIIASEV